MKKLLTILGALGLVATTGATVVACGETETDKFNKAMKEAVENIFKGKDGKEIQFKDFAAVKTAVEAVDFSKVNGNVKPKAKVEEKVTTTKADAVKDKMVTITLEQADGKTVPDKAQMAYDHKWSQIPLTETEKFDAAVKAAIDAKIKDGQEFDNEVAAITAAKTIDFSKIANGDIEPLTGEGLVTNDGLKLTITIKAKKDKTLPEGFKASYEITWVKGTTETLNKN